MARIRLLADSLVMATEIFARKNGYIQNSVEPGDERAAKMGDIISLFSFMSHRQRKEMATLMEIGCGIQNISRYIHNENQHVVAYNPYCVIVPLDNDNGHNYQINVPAINISDSTFVRVRSMSNMPVVDYGNSMTRNKLHVRPAQSDEIEAYIMSMDIGTLGNIMVIFNIVDIIDVDVVDNIHTIPITRRTIFEKVNREMARYEYRMSPDDMKPSSTVLFSACDSGENRDMARNLGIRKIIELDSAGRYVTLEEMYSDTKNALEMLTSGR